VGPWTDGCVQLIVEGNAKLASVPSGGGGGGGGAAPAAAASGGGAAAEEKKEEKKEEEKVRACVSAHVGIRPLTAACRRSRTTTWASASSTERVHCCILRLPLHMDALAYSIFAWRHVSSGQFRRSPPAVGDSPSLLS
jgi:hypothetical protein